MPEIETKATIRDEQIQEIIQGSELSIFQLNAIKALLKPAIINTYPVGEISNLQQVREVINYLFNTNDNLRHEGFVQLRQILIEDNIAVLVGINREEGRNFNLLNQSQRVKLFAITLQEALFEELQENNPESAFTIEQISEIVNAACDGYLENVENKESKNYTSRHVATSIMLPISCVISSSIDLSNDQHSLGENITNDPSLINFINSIAVISSISSGVIFSAEFYNALSRNNPIRRRILEVVCSSVAVYLYDDNFPASNHENDNAINRFTNYSAAAIVGVSVGAVLDSSLSRILNFGQNISFSRLFSRIYSRLESENEDILAVELLSNENKAEDFKENRSINPSTSVRSPRQESNNSLENFL